MINITKAEFLTSAQNLKQCPDLSLTEVAFLGRSNVGKSSLINALCNKKIAKSSSTPGKTQLINFFEINLKKDDENYRLAFVDLPGFGYAKVSKSMQDEWSRNLDEFIKDRINIKLFLHLIDSRQFDLDIDKNLDDYLNSFLRDDQRVIKIFTKSDKLNQSQKSKVSKIHKNPFFISVLKNHNIENLKELILKESLGC